MENHGGADPVEANLDKAMNDLRLYDLAVDLHGSRALGIAQRKSNVDVLITRPLESLLKELSQEAQSPFSHVRSEKCEPPWYLPPKVVLRHVSGIQLHLISRWSADIFVRERDAVARVCLAKDERVHVFLEMVMKWYYARSTFLPADQSYPTAYCFRLMALWHLMARPVAVVLPPLTPFGSFLNEKDENYIFVGKDKGTTSDDLVVEFLEVLAKASKPDKGIWADCRKPNDTGPAGVWQVIDPPSHKKLLNLKPSQIVEIGKMAKMDAKALRNNKGALDSISAKDSTKATKDSTA